MRKQPKKLRLHRETLRHLERRELARAAGGTNTNEIQTGCACTDTCVSDCGGCGSADACTTGQTFEILSGCATNC
jgi:hypothetical protein